MRRNILFVALTAMACLTSYEANAVPFDPTVRYSREVIDNCLYHFKANTTPAGFAQYDANGALVMPSESQRGFDYVPGLVAKAVVECVDYYQDSAFARPWLYSMQTYAEAYYMNQHNGMSLDDLNACKMYFGLYELTKPGAKFADSAVASRCQTAKANALAGLAAHNKDYAITSAVSNAFCGAETFTGGWWHKSTYPSQMWLDGQYMGPALLAQLTAEGQYMTGTAETDWSLITRQFQLCWDRLWDNDKQLLYHAFSADPKQWQTVGWADTQGSYASNPHYGVSQEFWGRAEGWYFLALIDVLELMPKGDNYDLLRSYLEQVAQGLAKRQDSATGCWTQLLQYPAGEVPPGCTKQNYIESSATAIFVASYLKAIRLGLLDRATYEPIALRGYRGFVENFLVRNTAGEDGGNAYTLVGCCASAGLSADRDGSAAYYLAERIKKDTERVDTYTEGKVLGAFILAAVEYERQYMSSASQTTAVVQQPKVRCCSHRYNLHGQRVNCRYRGITVERGAKKLNTEN